MTNKEIAKWLSDFHNDLENRTNKTHLTMKELLELMPEQCGRGYVEAGNMMFGTDYSYNEIMNEKPKQLEFDFEKGGEHEKQ